ncbi:MAG TPA: hypothetical protein PLA74_12420 [Syntrophales bacterium]|nr:hypothetical protein [Syntrophales bacterium]HPQ42870.1 hypothetical protein [Syntrophales bacterium]
MKRVKVSTREIVIVVIMVAAVLYGVYDLFIASSKPTDNRARVDAVAIDGLIADASEVLKDSGSYPINAHIVSVTDNGWKRDPFYEINTLAINASDLNLRYTGYLEIGKRKIAVINNESYEIGDELELGGYTVRRIKPSEIVIEEKVNKTDITIPFLEEE